MGYQCHLSAIQVMGDVCISLGIGITDIISDDADKGSTPNDALYVLELDEFTFDANNAAITGAWTGHHQVIFRANLAMKISLA